jgi:ribosomal protection tetracycline resistance protein
VTAIEVFDRGASARARCRPADREAVGPRRRADRRRDRRGRRRRRTPLRAADARDGRRPRARADGRAARRARRSSPSRTRSSTCASDEGRHELSVSLYGEVQKEVIEATPRRRLRARRGVPRRRRRSASSARSESVRRSRSSGRVRRSSPTLGLRVGPRSRSAPASRSGLDVKVESIPLYVYKDSEEFRSALEATVHDTLRQGLFGWEVEGLRRRRHPVRATPRPTRRRRTSASSPRSCSWRALREAGTAVCEPIHRFHLELPADTVGPALAEIARTATARRSRRSCTARRASSRATSPPPVCRSCVSGCRA